MLYIIIALLVVLLAIQECRLRDANKFKDHWYNSYQYTLGWYRVAYNALHSPYQKRLQRIYNSHLKKAYKKRYRSFFARGKELGTNDRGFALYNLNHAANQRHWLQSYKNNDLAGRAVKSNDVPVLLANHKKYLELAHRFTLVGPKLP